MSFYFFSHLNQKCLHLAINGEKHFVEYQRPVLSITLFIAMLHNKLLHAWWITAGEEVKAVFSKEFFAQA